MTKDINKRGKAVSEVVSVMMKGNNDPGNEATLGWAW